MNSKLTPFIAILAAVSILLVGFRQSPAASTAGPDRTISVNGEAEIRVVPDEVLITLGIHTWNSSLGTAKRENDRILERLLTLVGRYNIDTEDIRSDYMDIQPHYESWDYPERAEGYSVRKTVVITLKDMSRFEDFLTDVLGTGVNYVHGVEFRTTELRQYRDQARDLAVKAAREKAEDLSGALEMQIGSPLSIQEGSLNWWYWGSSWWGSSSYGMSQNVIQNAGGMEAGMESGVPGQITVRANVSVVFEMTASP